MQRYQTMSEDQNRQFVLNAWRDKNLEVLHLKYLGFKALLEEVSIYFIPVIATTDYG